MSANTHSLHPPVMSTSANTCHFPPPSPIPCLSANARPPPLPMTSTSANTCHFPPPSHTTYERKCSSFPPLCHI
ncbi:hypothetical protein BDQ17DRAFT_1267147 [Cyathus striatus]|nr:hypothetical protein BDQ17DRAFT_1267147 [Cyathus striatus]